MVALTLAAPERAASAGQTGQAGQGQRDRPSLSMTTETARAVMKLARAKKKRRPAGGGGSKAPAAEADDSEGADDDASKSSSSSGDAANEEELLGGSSKKKKAAAASSEDDAAGDGDAPKKRKSDTSSVETVESKASDEPSGTTTASALEFGIGAKALFRQLAWTADARASNLGPYSLTPGPETGGWLEFYPAAFGTNSFASNVGLVGRFDYGFGVATTLANNRVAATKFRNFDAGLKIRIPMGTFTPNVSVSYGQQLFEVAPEGTPQDLPQVAYQFVRPALGARMMFTPEIGLDAAAAYLMVMDPGSGANHVRDTKFFPDATAMGFDLSAALAVRLAGAVGLRGGIDFRQFILNMNDKTAPTVGGAVDRYIAAWVGVEVVLDGQGGAAGGDDEPAKPSKRKRRHASSEESKSSDDSDSSSSDEKASED